MKAISTLVLILFFYCVNAQVEFIKKCDISDGGGINYMATNGALLFFASSDSLNNLTPWISDGTTNGTFQLKDSSGELLNLHSVIGLVIPGTLCKVYKNEFYFLGESVFNEEEVWKSDGTQAGTYLLKKINPTSSISGTYHDKYPYFTELNDILYFSADDGTHGSELWRTDGTDTGTHVVKDIYTGYNPSAPEHLTLFKNAIYFEATDGNSGTEVWKTDGTSGGTQLLKDIFPGPGGCFYAVSSSVDPYFKVSGDYLYFNANADSPFVAFHEWRTDGTSSGTIQLGTGVEIIIGNEFQYTDVNGTFFFTGFDGNNNHSNLSKSDGTPSGTVNISSSPLITAASNFYSYHNKLYFNGNDGNNYGLCVSDGTPGGTSVVKAFPYNGSTSFVFNLTTDGNYLYGGVLEAVNPNDMELRLIQSDGTPAGTNSIKHYGFYGGLIPFKGEMYYAGYDTIIGSTASNNGLYAFKALNLGVRNVEAGTVLSEFYPNPFNTTATLNVKGIDVNGGHMILIDLLGRCAGNFNLTGESTVINRAILSPGLYFYRVFLRDGTMAGGGRVLISE